MGILQGLRIADCGLRNKTDDDKQCGELVHDQRDYAGMLG
jgi:hypothetical protein